MTTPKKAEAKRAFLIEQATACLAEKGYAHVSLRDIAKESGVSLGILHYYFASKEELLLAVISSYKGRFMEELEREVLAAPSGKWSAALARVLCRSLQEDRNLHRLWYDLQVQAMYVAAFGEQVKIIRARLHQLISRMLVRLQREEQSPLTIDENSAISLIYSAIDGFLFQFLLDDLQKPEEAIAHFELAFAHLMDTLFSSESLSPESR
ncbi:TetR/AcrR family transcriptional regulator [Brevibacillus sp. AF8]|uniref:TetR/AcrR family transcriptional regulator n=1 Tax=Brevibacillus sp. AF8 TaxID=2825881 RepID=UPI001E4D8B7F|nr:TetR/AcrR family transcriptional regulator [Brevibacillus sp. AF8]